jgi:hypothetical protein
MTIRLERTSAPGKLVLTSQCIAVLAGPIFTGALNAPLKAQATTQQPLSSAMPDWQVAAGKKLAFEVATIKPNPSDDPPKVNFTLGPGDTYAKTGGDSLRAISAYSITSDLLTSSPTGK